MDLKFILESILFTSQKPLSAAELRDVMVAAASEPSAEPDAAAFKKIKPDAIERSLEELAQDHALAGRSYRLVGVAGAWQFVSQPEFAPWIRALVGERARPPRLSQPALETLAIIAYRQPLTRAEMEQIRGVSVDGVMQTLLERGLIEAVGRAEVVGRPITYGTTQAFLAYFGLRRLDDLPDADELRRIPVARPEALATTEPAPVPAGPEQLMLATDAVGAAAPASGAEPAPAPERAPQAASPTTVPPEPPTASAP
jgi:segregation and condensation protein B